MQIYSCEYKKRRVFSFTIYLFIIVFIINSCKPTFSYPCIAHKKNLIPFIFIANRW